MNVKIDISNVRLSTKRLLLRMWQESDLDDFYEYAKVEGVGEMAGWPHHQDKEETRKILKRFIKDKKTFALVYKDKVIGSLGIEEANETLLKDLKIDKAVEIGFVLSKDYWGKGLMAEAAKEVIRYLFCEVRLEAIVCSYFVSNKQSQRVQNKCGFKYYKSYQMKTRAGTLEDTNVQLLTYEDWLEDLLDKWLGVLRIKNNWDVKLELVKDPDFKKTGDIRIDVEDKKAIVLLNVLDPKDDNLEETICHELLHLKLYPLDQFAENMIKANYEEGSKAQNTLYYEFYQDLEITVEELTKCFIKEFGDSKTLSFKRTGLKKSFEELYEGLDDLR